MFNKAMQELIKIAGSANIRPTLAGLYFKGNKIAVTDSFKLMEVTVPEYSLDDLPKSKTGFEFAKEKDIDFIIPSETIKDIKIPKIKSFTQLNRAFFGNIIKDQDGEIESVGISTNNLDKEINTQTRVLKGKFPDYSTFLKNDGTLKIGMDVNHLIDILTVYKKLGHRSLTFTMGTPLQPIIIEGDSISEDVETRAILMPLKI